MSGNVQHLGAEGRYDDVPGVGRKDAVGRQYAEQPKSSIRGDECRLSALLYGLVGIDQDHKVGLGEFGVRSGDERRQYDPRSGCPCMPTNIQLRGRGETLKIAVKSLQVVAVRAQDDSTGGRESRVQFGDEICDGNTAADADQTAFLRANEHR